MKIIKTINRDCSGFLYRENQSPDWWKRKSKVSQNAGARRILRWTPFALLLQNKSNLVEQSWQTTMPVMCLKSRIMIIICKNMIPKAGYCIGFAIISKAKVFILRIFYGRLSEYLDSYLEEFCFWVNRRKVIVKLFRRTDSWILLNLPAERNNCFIFIHNFIQLYTGISELLQKHPQLNYE